MEEMNALTPSDESLTVMDGGEAPDLSDAIAAFDPDIETEEPEW